MGAPSGCSRTRTRSSSSDGPPCVRRGARGLDRSSTFRSVAAVRRYELGGLKLAGATWGRFGPRQTRCRRALTGRRHGLEGCGRASPSSRGDDDLGAGTAGTRTSMRSAVAGRSASPRLFTGGSPLFTNGSPPPDKEQPQTPAVNRAGPRLARRRPFRRPVQTPRRPLRRPPLRKEPRGGVRVAARVAPQTIVCAERRRCSLWARLWCSLFEELQGPAKTEQPLPPRQGAMVRHRRRFEDRGNGWNRASETFLLSSAKPCRPQVPFIQIERLGRRIAERWWWVHRRLGWVHLGGAAQHPRKRRHLTIGCRTGRYRDRHVAHEPIEVVRTSARSDAIDRHATPRVPQ